jgi:hypothetical protein
LVK